MEKFGDSKYYSLGETREISNFVYNIYCYIMSPSKKTNCAEISKFLFRNLRILSLLTYVSIVIRMIILSVFCDFKVYINEEISLHPEVWARVKKTSKTTLLVRNMATAVGVTN